MMPAWEVTGAAGTRGRVRLTERPVPAPGHGEVLVRVEACGVCRTDLHVADGDLPPHRDRVVPGHEVVGVVAAVGAQVEGVRVGDRIGIAWLRATCGTCRWCRNGAENLCVRPAFTGWDADGGYAAYATVPAAYAYRLPEGLDPLEAAPLLCAGIIGLRALRRTGIRAGGRLGIYGFGASAHLTAQIALREGAEVHVLTRGAEARRLALDLGAASAGAADAAPPVPLDAAILFAPAGELVPVGLEALDRGGTLVLAGIHVSDIPSLDYQRHLFFEKHLTSVTANTRHDGVELFRLAGSLGLTAQVSEYPFESADQALEDLALGKVTGVAVLRVG
jgi:propanol-preferring alcohol dehydrogenase